jgi:hypothetical protein
MPKKSCAFAHCCTKGVWLQWDCERLNVATPEIPSIRASVGHPPLFFVSIASKGLSWGVSLLFATLAWTSISVAAKGLTVPFSEV